MIPVRVSVETESASVEYLVHVRNRSRHSLQGAVRSALRRYPNARSAQAEFTTHDCEACRHTHTVAPVRRPHRRAA